MDKEWKTTASFLVVHRLPDVATQEDVIAAGEAMAAALSNETTWLSGRVCPEEDRYGTSVLTEEL